MFSNLLQLGRQLDRDCAISDVLIGVFGEEEGENEKVVVWIGTEYHHYYTSDNTLLMNNSPFFFSAAV